MLSSMDPRYDGYEEYQALPVPRAVKTRPEKAVAAVRHRKARDSRPSGTACTSRKRHIPAPWLSPRAPQPARCHLLPGASCRSPAVSGPRRTSRRTMPCRPTRRFSRPRSRRTSGSAVSCKPRPRGAAAGSQRAGRTGGSASGLHAIWVVYHPQCSDRFHTMLRARALAPARDVGASLRAAAGDNSRGQLGIGDGKAAVCQAQAIQVNGPGRRRPGRRRCRGCRAPRERLALLLRHQDCSTPQHELLRHPKPEPKFLRTSRRCRAGGQPWQSATTTPLASAATARCTRGA